MLFVTTVSAEIRSWRKLCALKRVFVKDGMPSAYEELRESAMWMKRSVLNLIVSLSVYKMFLIKKSVCVN